MQLSHGILILTVVVGSTPKPLKNSANNILSSECIVVTYVFSHVSIVAIDHDRCTALQSAVPMTPSLQHSLVHYHSALPGSSYQHRVAPLLATGYYTGSTLAPGCCTAGHCGSVGCQSSSWPQLQVTPYQCNGYR